MSDGIGLTGLPDIHDAGILCAVDEPTESVGDRIRLARKAIALTQVQLANAMQGLGFSTKQSAISEWERGVEPDAKNLVGLSQALGQSTDYLLGIGPPRGVLAQKLSQKSGQKKFWHGTKEPVNTQPAGVDYRRSLKQFGVSDAHLPASRSGQFPKVPPSKAIQVARIFLDLALGNLGADAPNRGAEPEDPGEHPGRRRPRK